MLQILPPLTLLNSTRDYALSMGPLLPCNAFRIGSRRLTVATQTWHFLVLSTGGGVSSTSRHCLYYSTLSRGLAYNGANISHAQCPTEQLLSVCYAN